MYSPKVIAASRARLEESLGLPLREYSEGEVLDYAAQLKDVDWTSAPTEAVLATLPEDVQAYVVNEIQMCKIDWGYWARRYARVVDDRSQSVTFKPWPSQLDFLALLGKLEEEAWDLMQTGASGAELQARLKIILLKARQMGGTIISEMLLAHLLIFFSNSRTVIASDHPDNSLKLARQMLYTLDNLPGWMKPQQDARVKATNYHFPVLNSDLIVGSGNQKTTLGQGATIDAAHFTEVSTWEPLNCEAIDADMVPAFNSSRKHHTLFVLESTAAGGEGNWFHDVWQSAVNETSQFRPIFIGWFRAPHKWQANPEGMTFKETTLDAAARIKRYCGYECSRAQMAWYQLERQDKEVRGKLALFLQEHPSTPDEAFQMNMPSAFPIEVREKVRARVKEPVAVMRWNRERKTFQRLPLESWLGLPTIRTKDEVEGKEENCLIIWELAQPGYLYVVGHDSSYGLKKDSGSIQILRVGNKWRADEQVAEFASKTMPPSEFGQVLWVLGHLYADKSQGLPAKMVIEVSPGSPGIVPQTELMKRGYPNFYVWKRILAQGGGWTRSVGWDTNMRTRPILTEGGVSGISNMDLLVNSPYTCFEMDGFVVSTTETGQRKLEHAPGYHDDRLFALFMAFHVAHELDMVSMAEERRLDEARRMEPDAKPVQFQAMGLSWDECIAQWEANLRL